MRKLFLTSFILSSLSLLGNYFVPPIKKPTVDSSTGFNVQPGFQVDLVYQVDKKKFGSWIAMAFDAKGNLTVSDQQKAGTFSIEIPKEGEKFDESKIRKLNVASSLYGMLYAFDHLDMMGNRQLTRAKVLPDGTLGPTEFLAEMAGGGEHGPHSIIVSPDGKSIYVIAGNATKAPQFENSRIPTNWKDDVLLENYAYGHMSQGKAPGGWVMKMSPDGSDREMLNMGYRNPCDFALNRDGELFIYDADMEWDIGAPWYRPTRINHGVSGGESGWRATSKKWRKYFPDTVGSEWILDRAVQRALSQELMQNFPLIIVMHYLFVIGLLRPCIPFTSNPMVLHTLVKKENSCLIQTDLWPSLTWTLAPTVTCTSAWVAEEDSHTYTVYLTKEENLQNYPSWILPVNTPKHGPFGVCLKLSTEPRMLKRSRKRGLIWAVTIII